MVLRAMWTDSSEHEDLAAEVARLTRRLDDANRRLAALESKLDAEHVVVDDPAAHWVAEHRQEAASYRGKTVAIHPTRGIVASGDNLESVSREVRRMGLTEEVLLDVIPTFFE